MFGYHWFLEALYGLKSHKVRTIFTGFGVIWAMLILVLLQGAGTGFYNGMVKKFRSYSERTMSIRAGYRSGHTIHLTEALSDELALNLNVFEHIIPVFKTYRAIAYAQTVQKSPILGVRVGYAMIKHLELVEGRFFTERDIAQNAPVCILGMQMKAKLFDTRPAVGELIRIDGVVVCVIGVLEECTGSDNDSIIIPSNLFKALFPQNAENIDYILSTLAPKQNPIKVASKVRAYLAKRLDVETQDAHAFHISSASKRAQSFQVLFKVMQGFIWLVSLCFLVSGVVGVGNMMLVSLKQRTQEFAIRKVIGAQSSDIIGLILLESIVINLISGILGLGIGIYMLQWMNRYLLPIIEKHGIARFEFQFSMVLLALVVLVLSGCLAGIIPAKRACYIKPVNALNQE